MCTFFDTIVVIRPYGNYTGRRFDVCVVVLPDMYLLGVFFLLCDVQDDGEIHRRGDVFLYTSFSPL